MDFLTDANFHFYLITGLIGLLFLKDEIMPYIKQGLTRVFGFEGNPDGDKPATKSQMERLSSYYNHDTTALLKSIDDNIGNVHKAVLDLNKSVDKLDKSIEKLHDTHAEWEKYGIPTRHK